MKMTSCDCGAETTGKWADIHHPSCAALKMGEPRATFQILLDLLNPLHEEIDRQTYDEKVKEDFDPPKDREYNIDITSRMDHDLTQAVMILERKLRDFNPPLGG
jgi:hypothetical protein